MRGVVATGIGPGTGEPAEDIALLPPRPYISELTITQLIIYLVGFSEGLTHLATLAFYYLFKDDLRLSPPEVSAIFIVPAIPWIIKPLFAFCSDSYPIFGYRRKPYMILFSFLQALGFVILGLIPASVVAAIASLFLISFSAAFCSAIAEALVVESTMGKTHQVTAENVSDFISSKAIGSLIVAYFSGYLLEKISKQAIFLTTACFPLLITAGASVMKDTSETPRRTLLGQFQVLMQFLRQPIIWGPAVYILVYMAGPDYDDALFFYFTNRLGFSPSFMGTLRFTYGIAALLGILIYRYVFQGAGFRNVLLWTILISFPVYISPLMLVTGYNKKLGISNKMFVLSGGFLIEATAEIQLLPLLVLTASICPPGLEGSVYAMMMSVRNVGGMLSRSFSAASTYLLGITATNFANLGLYIIICGLFLLLPLFFLSLVPTDEDVKVVKKKHEEEVLNERNGLSA